MLQRSSTHTLIGLSSGIAIIFFLGYSKWNEETKESGKKSEKNASETYCCGDGSVSVIKANRKGTNASKPMFEYTSQELTKAVVDMADQRAKKWMSFRVSGAHCMVGQVGGKSYHKKPILILETFVMKPVRLDHRGIREIAFYEAIQSSSKRSGFQRYCSLFGPRICDENTEGSEFYCEKSQVEMETKLLHRLEPFTAPYFGTVEYNKNKSLDIEELPAGVDPEPFNIKLNSYILLNNVTKNFSKPCVLDIKMGIKTFEPDASPEKKSYELGKYSPQSDFGFRFTAIRMYDPSNAEAGEDGYVYYPKQYGRSLVTRESVKDALLAFLGGANLPKDVRANRSAAIQRILSRLKMIKGWFRDNQSFAFYGSSILVVYEGETEKNDIDGVELDMARAKMIDFGRVRRQPNGDLGYLKGLTKLVNLFEEILRESFLETSKYIRTKRYG
mmetsp:Transcript_13022/g.27558  ORF Transcript_13022/g.27558 Transcript_13022/m.27558 type:complete len:444 (-) Transcript_13022:3223-4554(-)